MRTIWFVLLISGSALAQCTGSPSCTVKGGGGGGYTTIQACATAMANGDSCTVFAGTYAEHVTVTAGGVASYKTLTVNTGDTVNVLDFTINSHDKLNGFSITNPSSPNYSPCVAVATLSTDYFITNNTMTACGGGVAAIYQPTSTTGTSFGYIGGNTISYTCSTPASPNVCNAIVVVGHHVLVENNDISHTTNGVRAFGQHNVIRKNTFHNIRGTNLTPSDCGSNSSNCHIVFVQQDSDTLDAFHPPSQYTLVENNTVLNAEGHDTKFALLQAEVCQGNCFNAIIRFNKVSLIDSGVVLDDNSGVLTTPGWSHVKVYNNTWANVNHLVFASGGASDYFNFGSPNGAGINNIYYYTVSPVNFNPIAVAANGTNTPFTVANNLAFCTGASCLSQLHSHTYGTGSWTDDPGNQYADPKFVNYGANNLALAIGSSALAAGTSLTTAVGSGASSTALIVADSDYFQDGAGITGVQADWIRIGASTTVQISSVVDSTHITLATAQTWSNNDPIYLYKDSSGTVQLNGANPNIGAFQVAGVPQSGSILTGNTIRKGNTVMQ